MVHRHYIVCILCAVILLVLGASAGLAQDDSDAVCTALQSTALTQTGTLCANTAPGSVCYGHLGVAAAFDAPTTEDFFTRPGDQAELSIIDKLSAWPPDVSETPHVWGVALMNTQANLPTEIINGPLNGRGVIYLLSGGVQVTDATPPDDLVEPLPQGVAVSSIAEADLRAAPVALDTPTSTNVISRIPSETQVSADAVTPDGDWVRVAFGDQSGWVSRAVIDSGANLNDLSVIGPGNFTPMQSVNLTRLEGDSACSDLTAGMLVQGPDPLPVDIRVNGVDVRITSSVLFVPQLNGTLEIWVISGAATIFPNDANRRVPIPPGFRAVIRLSDLSFVGGENGVPYLMMTDAEMAWLNFFTTDVPPIFMHYKPPLLRRIVPSGVGQPLILIEVVDRSTNIGIRRARQLCADGDIPAAICAFLAL